MNKLLFLLIFVVTAAFGQEKKLAKLLGPDLLPITGRTNIPYMETNLAVEFVPSTTFKGDTTGIVYQNEFLLFRNLHPFSQEYLKGCKSFAKTGYVTNKEYREFQQWLLDSSARERIYHRLPKDEEAAEWLLVPSKESKKMDVSNRDKNRRNHGLNWKIPVGYNNLKLMPYLADLYLPQNERFYKSLDFDQRRITYLYLDTLKGENGKFIPFHCEIATITHHAFWAEGSGSINDERSVLGQVYDKVLPGAPLVGTTGMQATAFCHWKEDQLQQKINKAHLPYTVCVTLPMMNELEKLPQTLNIAAKEYTSNWKITVHDYQLFMKAVRDSVILEHVLAKLCEEEGVKASELLDYKDRYLDESTLDVVDFDPWKGLENRDIFPLTRNPKVLNKYADMVKEVTAKYAYKFTSYKYFRVDIASKAMKGKAEKTNPGYIDSRMKLVEFLEISETDSLGFPVGMDLNLDYVNRFSQGSGVRDHEKYNRFIIREVADIAPTIPVENQVATDLIKGISYEQALAYYHWKFPIRKAQSGDDWQDYVYPNEVQFKQVQNGQKISVPEHQLNFPSPVFRYVVTFVPEK